MGGCNLVRQPLRSTERESQWGLSFPYKYYSAFARKGQGENRTGWGGLPPLSACLLFRLSLFQGGPGAIEQILLRILSRPAALVIFSALQVGSKLSAQSAKVSGGCLFHTNTIAPLPAKAKGRTEPGGAVYRPSRLSQNIQVEGQIQCTESESQEESSFLLPWLNRLVGYDSFFFHLEEDIRVTTI